MAVTVKKGDTLSGIAAEVNKTVSELAKINNIPDPDYIVVGQTIYTSSSEKPSSNNTRTTSGKPKITVFGLQSNTDRTVYATWTWDKDKDTENYEVLWKYATAHDSIGFIGNRGTTEEKQSLYTAPENATHVAFCVKPISKKKTVNGKETDIFTADWSTTERYYFKDNPPSVPSAPTVEIKDYTLTAKLENLDVNGTTIEFQVVKNDSSTFCSGTAKIKTNAASYSCTITAGGEYKVRCRALRDGLKSDWSDYSDNQPTAPAAPNSILELRALTETSIYMDWSKVSTATQYEIEYATKKSRFDSSDEAQSLTVESVVSHAEIDGLESGEEWFFRVRAINNQGHSGWTPIKSVKIGTKPAVPTTWSLTTKVKTGEDLILYWVHNSEDGSSQTYAELELIINGETTNKLIKNTTDEKEKDKTSSYTIETSGYAEGTKILWRVKTRGVLDTYSDWSIQRTVDVYAPPSLSLGVTDSDGEILETLKEFPFHISGVAGPNTQKPVGYHVSIIANEVYETVDSVGNAIMVNKGEDVYSEHFDIDTDLSLDISASNIHLENNISYKIIVTVSMDSGLTAEASKAFTVGWTDDEYWPTAEIGYDPTTYSTFIRPYCTDENDELIEGILLSVYRREFDGTFTELGVDLDNLSNTYITDPHPSLDYARYRIVGKTVSTGKISFYDVPGYPIGEKAVIIQWDEDWTNFNATEEAELEQPAWSGSLLRLPYNIDVADKHNSDVELVEYIGRKHPVSYYGTQLGETSTWNVDIDKQDKETLYALRRLAIWMGDVYVREPSGSGYWANISVSFSQKHCEVTIPVTLDIARVAGGV